MAGLWVDVTNGAIIGSAAGLLEMPFVAAGAGDALGYGALGDAALSAQSAILGTIGTLVNTCSLSAGCLPAPEAPCK